LAVGAGVAVWTRSTAPPAPQVIERVVVREVEKPAPEVRWTNDTSPSPRSPRRDSVRAADFAYLQLRQTVLAGGPESLRAPRAAVPSSDDVSNILEGGRATPAAAPRSVINYLLPGGRL
jgi:hypothetical protein